MKITLMDFLSGEDRPINVNELTVSDAIYMLKDRVFDQHFDRKKILNFITQLSKDFFTKYYGREFCPRCLSSSVEEIKSYEGVKKSFLCKDCGKKFKHRGVMCTHFEDWVILRIQVIARLNRVEPVVEYLHGPKISMLTTFRAIQTTKESTYAARFWS